MLGHMFRLILAGILYFKSSVCGDLVTISERNVASAVNGSVSFACMVSGQRPIRWQHTPPLGIPSFVSPDGKKVKDSLSSRVHVAWDPSTGRSMLAITKLESEDAGSYECLETGNVKKGFELTVIDAIANSMCQLNTSFRGYRTFRPHDFVEVSCLVNYAGNWAPNISCITDTPRLSTFTNVTSRFVFHHFVVSGSSLLPTGDDVDIVIFVCTAGFRGPPPAAVVARGNVERDVIAPLFETTWKSTALYFSDQQTTRAWVVSNGSNGQLTIIMTSSILSVVGVLAICAIVMIVVMTRFMRNKTQETATKVVTEEDTTYGQSRQPEVIDLQPVAPLGVVYNGGTHYDEINDEVTEPHEMQLVKVPYEGLVGMVRVPAPVPLSMYDNLGTRQGNGAVSWNATGSD